MPAVRKKLGTGSPGKVVPGSSLPTRETGWDAKCTLSKCSEVPLWRRCASPWAPEETPAGEGGVGGALEWPPCDSIRTCHQEGKHQRVYDSLKPLWKDPASGHFPGGFVSISGPQR